MLAEDGNIYEKAIALWCLERKNRSPMTNKPMGKSLREDLRVRSMLRTMAKPGALSGEKADAWLTKIADEELV